MLPIIYLFVMILAQTIFNSVDTTMLGVMHGDWEVGIYSTAHKIYNLINQIVGSLLWVIMPRMSYYFAEKDYNKANKLLRKVLGYNLLVGLPSVVGCFIMAEDIIRVVAGGSYIEAATVLRILMIGFVFSLVGGNFLGNAILLPSKREKYYMVVCCITAIVNMMGNYLFIPLWGVNAAAGTTAFCSLTILILLLFKIDKHVKIQDVRRMVCSPIAGCLGIIIICLACKTIETLWIRVIISVLLCFVVYGLIQLLLKNELVEDVLRSMRRKILNNN